METCESCEEGQSPVADATACCYDAADDSCYWANDGECTSYCQDGTDLTDCEYLLCSEAAQGAGSSFTPPVCPDEATPSPTDDKSQCGAGATGPDGGPCDDCQAGKYKSTTGTEPCISCPAGKFSTDVGATGVSSCTICPANSHSPIGSETAGDCSCNSGATGPHGGPCAACGTGKYKTAAGSDACTDCAADSDSPAGSTASTSCTCNAGFTGPDGEACAACAAGKFKTEAGPGECENCGVNTYSGAVAISSQSMCKPCPAGSSSEAGSTAQSDCREGCPPGQTGEVGSCIDCAAGTFKETVGSGSCLTCPDNTQSDAGQHECTCNAGDCSEK